MIGQAHAIGVLIAPVGALRSKPAGRNSRHFRTTGAEDQNDSLPRSRSNWFGVLLSLGIISGGTVTQYFLLTLTPYAIRTLHLPDSAAMLGAVTLGLTGCIGALAGGLLADRWGIHTIAIVPRIVLMLVLFPTMKLLIANPSATTLILSISVLSLLQAMSAGVGVMVIPLIFPRAVRATALALTYSVGVAVFGGMATYVVTWLVGATGDPRASTYYVMAANFALLAAFLTIRNADFDSLAERVLSA